MVTVNPPDALAKIDPELVNASPPPPIVPPPWIDPWFTNVLPEIEAEILLVLDNVRAALDITPVPEITSCRVELGLARIFPEIDEPAIVSVSELVPNCKRSYEPRLRLFIVGLVFRVTTVWLVELPLLITTL
jgi:hypothetical protein